MKITICGSIAFIDEMVDAKRKLEAKGHEVQMPPTEVPNEDGELIPVKEYYAIRKAAADGDDWVWDLKAEAIRNHFNKVAWSDAILVLNMDKNGIPHYLGPNTFLEAGLAFHLQKPIYFLNPLPEISYKEELLAMRPIVLAGDLEQIA